jgi:hypothetical protein
VAVYRGGFTRIEFSPDGGQTWRILPGEAVQFDQQGELYLWPKWIVVEGHFRPASAQLETGKRKRKKKNTRV